jgi:hypothetical protein
MRCSGLANGTTSKMHSCLYSRERLTLKRRKHDFVGKVLPHHSRTSEHNEPRERAIHLHAYRRGLSGPRTVRHEAGHGELIPHSLGGGA